MRVFAILTLGLVCSVQSHTIVPIPFSRIIPRDGCAAGSETCSSDCRSILYCNTDGQQEPTNCMASTGKPYCEKLSDTRAQCSSSAESCIKFSDICPEDGMYPNLLDCTKYVHCTGTTPTNAVCDPKLVFHGGEHMCLSGIKCYNYDSVKGLCKGKDQVRLPYPLNTKLYVYCSPGGPKLRKCPETVNIQFDPKQGTCVFVCPAQGLFQDKDDPHYYFECAKVSGGFQATRKKCPDGTTFDEKKKECTVGGETAPEQ